MVQHVNARMTVDVIIIKNEMITILPVCASQYGCRTQQKNLFYDNGDMTEVESKSSLFKVQKSRRRFQKTCMKKK